MPGCNFCIANYKTIHSATINHLATHSTINEVRCFEAKIEESEKASSHRES